MGTMQEAPWISQGMMQEAPWISQGMQHEVPTPLIGYRFSPTDEEIILHYLQNKIHRLPLSYPYAIIECDLYGEKNAWTKFFDQSGESTLYFFTKLRKKTEKGSRVERVTSCGTWRTQSDNKIVTYHGNKELHIGSRRSFTFVSKKESGVKGRWVMHEYRLDGIFSKAKKDVDDYVLCRVKKKKPTKKEEEKIVEVQQVNNIVNITPAWNTSLDTSQPVNNNVSITPAWNTSEDLERIPLDWNFGEVQPVNNNFSLTPIRNTSEYLERILLDSNFSEVGSDLSLNHGIRPQELEDVIAKG